MTGKERIAELEARVKEFDTAEVSYHDTINSLESNLLAKQEELDVFRRSYHLAEDDRDIAIARAEAAEKALAALKEQKDDLWLSSQIAKMRKELAAAQERIKQLESQGWYCGCGHTNGINLAVCAACGRQTGETR